MVRSSRWWGSLALLVLAAMIASLSQFLRSAHGVIGPDLIQELGLDPAQFSALSGVFFLLAAISQLPAGALFDRVGPRRVLTSMLLITTLSTVLFSQAVGSTGLIGARALMGFGCGGLVIGCMVLFSRWFAPGRFAVVLSVTIGLSQSGNIMATTPMASLSELFGWRSVFLFAAIVPALLAVLVYFLLRDNPPDTGRPTGTPTASRSSMFGGILALLTDRRLWPVYALAASGYSSMIMVLGLWGGTYLHDVHDMEPVERGHVLLSMVCLLAMSQFMVGPLLRRIGNLRDTAWYMSLPGVTGLLLLAFVPHPPAWLAVVGMLLVGSSGGTSSPMIAHGRAFYPAGLTGRGMTLTNSFVTLGVFIVQWGSGLLIHALAPADSQIIPEYAFRTAFLATALLLFSAGLWFRLGPATPPN